MVASSQIQELLKQKDKKEQDLKIIIDKPITQLWEEDLDVIQVFWEVVFSCQLSQTSIKKKILGGKTPKARDSGGQRSV